MKLVRFLLFPFAILYDLITSIRNFFFDIGIFKTTSFDFPVIAVGNLSVGGTGKTPQIEYLIRLLSGTKKVAVLSRGYKRKTKGFVLINDDHNAVDVGDEPLQFYKKFSQVSIAVDANRVAGIQRLKEEVNPDVVLLDDAYQHRKVKAGFYVLLTKYDELYTNDFILPTGNLRESRRGAKRADVIIVTKCSKDLSAELQQRMIRKLKPTKDQQVFFTRISYADSLRGSHTISLNDLPKYEIVLVTGIANPKSLLDFLDAKHIDYTHLKYPDHHEFSESDITTIKSTFEGLHGSQKLILTTEKDYMRLSHRIDMLSYIEIETQFLNGEEEFDRKIIDFI